MKFFLVCLPALFICTTNCVQKHTLLGITSGYSTTVWIQEDVGGECSYTMLEMVTIDTSAKGYRSTNYFSGDSTAMRKFIRKNFQNDSLREVFRSGNSYSYGNVFSLCAPNDSVRLREKFESWYGSPTQWNKVMGDSGIIVPKVNKGRLTLAYAAPEGFYVNYAVTRVWYSETGRLVIVFTRGCCADGGDTSNGYLIFKVKDSK